MAWNTQFGSDLILIHRMYQVDNKSPTCEMSKQPDNFKIFILEWWFSLNISNIYQYVVPHSKIAFQTFSKPFVITYLSQE